MVNTFDLISRHLERSIYESSAQYLNAAEEKMRKGGKNFLIYNFLWYFSIKIVLALSALALSAMSYETRNSFTRYHPRTALFIFNFCHNKQWRESAMLTFIAERFQWRDSQENGKTFLRSRRCLYFLSSEIKSWSAKRKAESMTEDH